MDSSEEIWQNIFPELSHRDFLLKIGIHLSLPQLYVCQGMCKLTVVTVLFSNIFFRKKISFLYAIVSEKMMSFLKKLLFACSVIFFFHIFFVEIVRKFDVFLLVSSLEDSASWLTLHLKLSVNAFSKYFSFLGVFLLQMFNVICFIVFCC